MIEIFMTKVAPMFGPKNYGGSETPRRYPAPNALTEENKPGQDYPKNGRHYNPPPIQTSRYNSTQPTERTNPESTMPTGRYNHKGQPQPYQPTGQTLDTRI